MTKSKHKKILKVCETAMTVTLYLLAIAVFTGESKFLWLAFFIGGAGWCVGEIALYFKKKESVK